MFKLFVLPLTLCFSTVVFSHPYFYYKMKPCPTFKSQGNIHVDKMMGKWNLVMLFMDEKSEEYDDDSSCIQGDFKKINETAFKQMWYINSPHSGYAALVELPTAVTHLGDWEIIDPLGGNLTVKVLHASPKSRLTMTFCMIQHGKSVHLWTAVAMRKTSASQIELLQVSSELLAKGFDMNDITMITWNKC
ncbi:uncharacterized protein [Periplaneta americana]|uniref:uncharacterized protein n=1 Tax=Periplaneta americana TaxID=6978 RepID=UPI0037E9500B